MTSKRNNQRQIWADEEFVKKLEEIKAKRLLIGKPVKNVGALTKELITKDSFKDLENELLNFDTINKKRNEMRINLKFDGLL